jgi:two-component system cell cycle response regulator CpdR
MANILIAEDDASMRKFISMTLEKEGHNITSSEDGLDALSRLENHKDFDLLLTDIVMPGMDGIELSQKAANLIPGIKIMFITGFAAVALGERNPDHDNAQVISKPFHMKELVAEINNLLTEPNASTQET